MTSTLSLERVTANDIALVGGKTVALAELAKRGYLVPLSLAITCDAYSHYLKQSGLGDLLSMELGRKAFPQMRWEELWDAALRIRNLFLTTPFPKALEAELDEALTATFSDQPLVIRSSAPGEDSASCSFAGLHDSFVNVHKRPEQLLAVRKVWASLWSDRALLYRQELGLDIDSSIAVLVQELVDGEKSGVAFSVAPGDSRQLAIEAVWGLNQGLVDGSVEPDCWTIDRQSQTILAYRPARREKKLVTAGSALQIIATTSAEENSPVLMSDQVMTVSRTAMQLEQTFKRPQDCEWTWKEGEFTLLQARPITASREADPRSWYFNLHRSLDNLKQLQRRIEEEIIPGMEETAQQLAEIDLTSMADQELIKEFNRRRQILNEWEEAYRADCIPMAHGIRLFGEFYNDRLQPNDPFEFIELLRDSELRAVTRNQRLTSLADEITNLSELPAALSEKLSTLADEIGLSADQTRKLLGQMVDSAAPPRQTKRIDLEKNYLEQFKGHDLPPAEEILAIGRSSYKLRDDDNISLDQLNRELRRTETEMQSRLEKGDAEIFRLALDAAKGRDGRVSSATQAQPNEESGNFHARQLQGQPASPGLVTAVARVIRSQEDLVEFKRGEILVCDAIDPAMTFVVPLAAGIIERRGGMLIHGAIIAREYGIPCVSGIAAAADIINTGDQITLDGYLGLVFFPSSSGRLSRPGKDHLLRKELDDAK